MKKLITLILCVMIVLTGCRKASEREGVINIGVSQLVEYVALDDSREGFITALRDNGYIEGENINIEYQNAQGDIAVAQTIGQKFASENKDLIFAIATGSAQGAYNATKEIPIVITAVTDPMEAGIVESLDKPGTNVSGTSDYLPVDNQLELIKKLAPNAKKIGVIYNTSEINSEVQVNELKDAANGYEIITTGVSSTNDVDNAITNLIPKIDILYVPTDNLVVSAMPIISKKANEAKIPVIAAEKGCVEAGALATAGIDYYRLGYEAGQIASEVLKGKNISEIPIKISNETNVYINKATLNVLDITMPELDNVEYIK